MADRYPRYRRTTHELQAIRHAIYQACILENPVSLRGVFYRVVSANIPTIDKSDSCYLVVQRELLRMRRASIFPGRYPGIRPIPFSWITDDTRQILRNQSYSGINDAIDRVASFYRREMWADQPNAVYLFSEKSAILGAIEPVTDELNVPIGIMRGGASETLVYNLSQFILREQKPVFCYQLGDHDPAGLDQWYSVVDRVTNFIPECDVTWERLAVTEEQIADFDLFTRETKRPTQNWPGGDSCEVDAIAPTDLRQIVRDAITRHLDPRMLRLTLSVEASEQQALEWLGMKSPAALTEFAESNERDEDQ